MKKNKKKIKLSNQLLLNYVMIISMVAIFVLAMFAGYIRYNFFGDIPLAIWDDDEYSIITKKSTELSQVIEHEGFYEIIDEDMVIVKEENSTFDEGYEYTIGELFRIIITGKRGKYHVVLKFDSQTDNMVIVGLPIEETKVTFTENGLDKTKLRMLIKRTIFVFLAVFVILSVLLYAKITSKAFVKPIMALLKSFDKMKDGDYSARVEIKDNVKEIVQVKKAFNHMAEKIQMESNLKKQSEKNRKQLILDISHDLKNPLTSIQGYSEFLIKNDKVSREKSLEILEIINKNSVRANLLINELFQYSKLQNEKYEIKLEKNDINEFLREIIASFIPRMEKKEFDYETNISDEEINVWFDWKELDRAISNIIDNALKYNPKGTKINLELVDGDEFIEIIISDDGEGIPKELHERIFDAFVRGDESRNSNTGGTGLGLAIADNIIKRHNGKITLKNKEKGSAFVIELPKNNH